MLNYLKIILNFFGRIRIAFSLKIMFPMTEAKPFWVLSASRIRIFSTLARGNDTIPGCMWTQNFSLFSSFGMFFVQPWVHFLTDALIRTQYYAGLSCQLWLLWSPWTQLCLLHSGRPLVSAWAPLASPVTRKLSLGGQLGLTLFISHHSEITALCCLMSSVLGTTVLHVLSHF